MFFNIKLTNEKRKKNNFKEKQNKIKSRELKIIIVGDSGAGKTKFVNRYILNKFVDIYQATIVSQFSYKILKIGDLTYRLYFGILLGKIGIQKPLKYFVKIK